MHPHCTCCLEPPPWETPWLIPSRRTPPVVVTIVCDFAALVIVAVVHIPIALKFIDFCIDILDCGFG